MAHGPCGEEFRAAFSCFVFSKEEPKGMDCVEKFKGMQTCFRAHPEEYGDQLDEDEEEVEQELLARENLDVDGDTTQMVPPTLKEEATQESSSGANTEAGKASTPDTNALKNESQSAAKKPIYDSTSEKANSNPELDSKTTDKSKDQPSSASKADGSLAGDENGELIPKAAHDATS